MLMCPDFSQCKIMVIGDAMLDRYWHGDTSRISPEAPVPIVKIDKDEERVGGAANVALNLSVLGANTSLISEVGEDSEGNKLLSILTNHKVFCDFFISPIKTTLKLRVLGRHQQLIRLDFEDKHQLNVSLIIEKLKKHIDQIDILILSDYAKGVLSNPQEIIRYACEKGVKILVDPKNPDLNVYRGATVLTPNLGEFEAAVGICENEAAIEKKGKKLLEKLGLQALLVTRGSQGMSLIQRSEQTVHIPAKAREVFDITGAGDTVIAVLGASIAAGKSFLDAAKLANLAAGLAVGRLGTATISEEEIQAALFTHHHDTSNNIISLGALLSETQRRKSLGHKIVLTNGCFDILHVGHITYLQQARALGDCLIVAVNDDLSVKRLKGSSRPVNPLSERMQVLAALECVDYVVSFSEDTPERLIAQILPHVLVKGGDYRKEDIAGGAEVIANGGEVIILSFVPGCSTTKVIEKMKSNEELVV